MKIITILKFIYTSENPHFLSVDKDFYSRWKLVIKVAVSLNKNYKSCEIYRKKYKMMEDFVVIGLKYNGKNVKRRTSGYAKEFIEQHKEAKCLYCETKLNDKNATADHIVPISKGGNNTQVNLIVTCFDCNNEKGSMSFNEYIRYKNTKLAKSKYIFI